MNKKNQDKANIMKNKVMNEDKAKNSEDEWKLSMQELLKGGCMINWDSPSIWEKTMPDVNAKKKSA